MSESPSVAPSWERSIKEVVRHLIAKSGMSRASIVVRKARGENVEHLLSHSVAERFSAIYRNRVWLNDRPSGSLSGRGSEVENTGPIREWLPEILVTLGARSVLDIGCGDFTWMK